jgi:hypothetical protein
MQLRPALPCSPVHCALHGAWLVVAIQGVVKPRQVHCRQGGCKGTTPAVRPCHGMCHLSDVHVPFVRMQCTPTFQQLLI